MAEEEEDLKKDEEAPEDESEGEDDSSDGEEKKGGKKNLILFVAVPIVLLIAVGAGLYFTGMLDGLLGGDSQEESVHADDGHGKKKAKDGHGGGHAEGSPAFLEVPPMIVNLRTEDGVARYLRLKVQLELETEEDKETVESVLPRVVDQFQTYLRELRVKDLRGSAGIYRLQMELLWRVNRAADPVEIKDVLFQEILIQ